MRIKVLIVFVSMLATVLPAIVAEASDEKADMAAKARELTQAGREWYEVMGKARKLYLEEHPFPYATLDDVIANFQHAIALVGVDHVGVGSDFDGVGDSLPEGMKDVSFYPRLIEKFLRLEYSPEQIQAIMGGNLMRVWRQIEDHAASFSG